MQFLNSYNVEIISELWMLNYVHVKSIIPYFLRLFSPQ